MNHSLTGRRRWCRAPTLVAGVLLSLLAFQATAVDNAAKGATASPSQQLQQRFTAAADGWRKAVAKLPDPQPHEAQLVRELRVVVAPTPVPLLRVQRRLEAHTIIVSAGWLALLDELLRAEVVYAHAGRADCMKDFASQLMHVIRDNRDRAASAPRPAQRAWPRLASWLESADAPEQCKGVESGRPRSPAVQARVVADTETVALWLLTRQAALLVGLPVPAPASSAAAASAAAGAPPGDSKLSCSSSGSWPARAAPTTPIKLECSAVLPSPSAAASAAPAPLPAPMPQPPTPDQRAQQALDSYGLRQPAALSWLRANADLMFDAETVRVLSP